MARIVTVTSGKGGVGKTNLSANLCMQLAAMGYRSCIFDADLGLANINIVLGLYPEYTVEDVILHNKTLSEVIIKDHQGIDIVPGSSGVEKIANIAPEQTKDLIESFAVLEDYDFLLFDTSAGVSKNVVSFCLASSEIILLITPEPTSLTDAYALLKILCLNGLNASVKVVVNQCRDTTIAKKTYSRFKEVVKKYLSLDIQPLGVILLDDKVSEAVKNQQTYIKLYPDTIASKCIRVIANNFLEQKSDSFEQPSVESFLKRFISHFSSQLHLKSAKEGENTAETQPVVTPSAAVEPSEPASMEPGQEEAPEAAATAEPEPVVEEPSDAEKPEPAPALTEPVLQQAPVIDASLQGLIGRLVDNLSSISEEVRELRKTIEGNGHVLTPSGSVSSDKESQKNAVILDFDSFMRGREREK